MSKGLEIFDSKGRRYSEDQLYMLLAIINTRFNAADIERVIEGLIDEHGCTVGLDVVQALNDFKYILQRRDAA